MSGHRRSRHRYLAAVLAALLFQGAAAGPTITELEDAIEARSVELRQGPGGTLTAVVRQCDRCPEIRLEVARDARAYQGGREVELERAARLVGENVVVFFTVKDRKVSRITW